MTTKKQNVVENEEENNVERNIETTLEALYTLQRVDSEIDQIRIQRGELPLEVQDLEDEIAGLQTRAEKYASEIKTYEKAIADLGIQIKECTDMVKKYEEQQNNVRNNREYDSLTKEIESQSLDIQLCEKRIRENKFKLEETKAELDKTNATITERSNDLEIKKSELDEIIRETEAKEQELLELSKKSEQSIDDRYLTYYKRLRKNARNGLAVATITNVGKHAEINNDSFVGDVQTRSRKSVSVKKEEDDKTIKEGACGGCNNVIPPQHLLNIRIHKNVIVCEFCGRILVDNDIVKMYEDKHADKKDE